MGKLIDFEQVRSEKGHKQKEAKLRRVRESFRAARQSWQSETATTSSLKQLLKRKKNRKPNH